MEGIGSCVLNSFYVQDMDFFCHSFVLREFFFEIIHAAQLT